MLPMASGLDAAGERPQVLPETRVMAKGEPRGLVTLSTRNLQVLPNLRKKSKHLNGIHKPPSLVWATLDLSLPQLFPKVLPHGLCIGFLQPTPSTNQPIPDQPLGLGARAFCLVWGRSLRATLQMQHFSF